jgi:hypothetical protein
MSSKLDIIREYKKLTEQCKVLVELFCQFDGTLDKFEKESGTTVKEAIQILDEIGDSNADLIRLTIARLTESIGNVEPIAEVPNNVEIPTTIETAPQVVEVVEESTETSKVEEKVTSQVEISSNDPTKKDIHIEGYPKTITVYRNGNIEVDGKILQPFMTRAGVTVKLPLEAGNSMQYVQHHLVAQAYLPKPNPKKKDGIIHKNDNPFDCRVSNLGWRSCTSREIPKLDESDAVDICEALLASNFDIVGALNILAGKHKRCSIWGIKKIMSKESFVKISDKYFDKKLNPVKKETPKLPGLGGHVETKPIENVSSEKSLVTTVQIGTSKVFDRKHAISESLEAHGGDILEAYETSKSLLKGLTIYEVFNVKKASEEGTTEKDVAVVIRCARNGGCDIKETLRNECSLLVTESEITRATRKQA